MSARHRIEVADGERVVAVHHPGPSERWFVCCHGFVSDMSGSYESRCERAVAEGYDAVRFDFRGCGESDRAFADATLSTRVADLRAVLAHFDPPRYLLFGSSFGAKTALHTVGDGPLAGDDRLVALAGRAPVTYNRCFDPMREAVAAHGSFQYPTDGDDGGDGSDDDREYTVDGRFFDDFEAYAFPEAADGIDVPVALFHGTDDGSVPLGDSLDAVGELDGDVLLRTFAGEAHRFSRTAEARMRDALFDWLARLD